MRQFSRVVVQLPIGRELTDIAVGFERSVGNPRSLQSAVFEDSKGTAVGVRIRRSAGERTEGAGNGGCGAFQQGAADARFGGWVEITAYDDQTDG